VRGWAAGFALCLAGCTVGPDYTSPAVDAPARFGAERTDVRSRATDGDFDPAWWQQFGDPVLSKLVARIATQNLDLQIAAERVLQGRAQVQVVASQGLPQIRATSSYMRERLSPTGDPSALVVARPGAPLEFDVFQNGLNSSWDLDLFGRVRRQTEAAAAQTQAAIEDRHGIALAAVADLAQDYLQLRGVQAELAIAESNLALARQNTTLVRNRFDNGVATTLDIARAKAQEATIAATVPGLRTQQAALVNAIGLLLGEAPRAMEAELTAPAAAPAIPVTVPVGLPSTLVRRRPDLRRAEANLHAATAQIGVAQAEFYPDITLTGSFELQGLRFKDAFSLYSRAFDVGPSVSLPIFQGGRLRGTLKLREAQQREAAIQFRQTLLQAWQEVDDALTRFAETQAQATEVASAVSQNEIALRAARQRYAQGAGDFLDINVVQAQLLQSQNDLAGSQTRIATALVSLYRALGGGWETVAE
jgi:NodT family efflux transporter outer membrane factor (OMF) lipoprotein